LAEDAWPTDRDFYEAVERYVTPAMATHGYVVCSSGEGKASDTGRTLARVPPWRAHRLVRGLPPLRRTRLVRQLAVGYEGDSGNEFWVSYFPDRRRLDLTWWHAVAGAAATLDEDVEDGRPG
jgi:hypothetical protein